MNFSNSSFEQTEKVLTSYQLKRKTKTERSYSNSKFKQTEKVPTFYKLNVIIETENQNRKTVFQFLDFNKQIKKSTKRQHRI